jgi:hypothetical protein
VREVTAREEIMDQIEGKGPAVFAFNCIIKYILIKIAVASTNTSMGSILRLRGSRKFTSV